VYERRLLVKSIGDGDELVKHLAAGATTTRQNCHAGDRDPTVFKEKARRKRGTQVKKKCYGAAAVGSAKG